MRCSGDKNLQEAFARGIFPSPIDLFKSPFSRSDANCEVHWWPEPPEDGCISSSIFVDGSGFFKDLQGLEMAGWSAVQIDNFGNSLRIAYGAVPGYLAWQQSGDGEDYAVYMCARLARPDLEGEEPTH